jgi:GT2 family glycosyltransferase
MTSDTAVVFVNYMSERLIAPRAEALIDHGLDVYVVDNSGTYRGEGDVDDPGLNLGFGAACNRALAQLQTHHRCVVLHNPDVDATPAQVVALAGAVGRQRCPGAAAASLMTPSGRRPHGYHYPSLVHEAVVSVRGRAQEAHAGGRLRRLRGLVPGRRFGSGALLALSPSAFERIGGFDERFFLYVEDCDLWHRLRLSGRETDFATDVVVQHKGKSSGGMEPGPREVLRWLGVELFAQKHRRTGWRVYRKLHEVGIRRLVAGGEPLASDVAEHWRTGLDPASVASAVRERLVRR